LDYYKDVLDMMRTVEDMNQIEGDGVDELGNNEEEEEHDDVWCEVARRSKMMIIIRIV
jgi:hypothetical protein